MLDVDQVVGALAIEGRPVSAADLARKMQTSRKEVNSILYQGLGVRFLRSEDKTPKWSLVCASGSTMNQDNFKFRVSPDGPIHVDHQGGDWTLVVALASRSRNDPPYVVEMTGLRQARVVVNSTLLGEQGSEDWGRAYLVAAFALTNQILLTRLGDPFAEASPEILLRDTLLSFAVSNEATD